MTKKIYENYYSLKANNSRVDRLEENSWRIEGKTFDHNILVKNCEASVDRSSELYEAHESTQIELTMSCNKEEAIAWMTVFMTEALAAGLGVCDVNLRAKFLTAHDIRQSLFYT